MIDVTGTILLALLALKVETVPLSAYWPGDGHNSGALACGGRYTADQEHIAVRRWWAVGCGRPVLVCAAQTRRCAITRVRDAGPYGVTDGRGRWRVHTGSRAPEAPWRYRGGVDLSRALWVRLGRPRFLSRAWLVWLPADARTRWRRRGESHSPTKKSKRAMSVAI